MPLIGTAGHVDHGKSTLIQRLTGRDPDRWAEEKKRGLTIDLGFAWATLPGDVEVSFVDVPGHERFLKNMLAGIEAVDAALLVVAADEGWMPQSEEHLAVLDLLEVRRGVVALTKSDLVDDELLALAMAEVEERLEGTTLESAPVIPVSGLTGAGIEDLERALVDALPREPQPSGRRRMWVDRSFPVAGAGTVVTGSLLGGPVSTDDQMVVYPAGLGARVRSIQSHERTLDVVGPGRRVALNLSGIPHDQVTRGDMIGDPGAWELSRRFAARIRVPRFVDELDRRGSHQLHLGTASTRATIDAIDEDIAVVRMETALPLVAGERFILRDTGRRLVVAGGQVLDPAPRSTRRALRTSVDIDLHAGPEAVAAALLAIRGIESADRLAAHAGAAAPPDAITAGGQVVDPGTAARLSAGALTAVTSWHETHPLRPGMPLATLAERLSVTQELAEHLVETSPDLERIGPDVRRAGHAAGLTEAQELSWARAEKMLAAGLDVPNEPDLGLDPDLIALKIRSGELIRIGPGLVYLPDQIDRLRAVLASLGGEFTVADFRDASGLTRKYAVPFLEWADREGLTVRRGDTRRLR